MILIERESKRGALLGFNIENKLVARECTTCKEYKATDSFTKKNTSKTNHGFNTRCKVCDALPGNREKFNKSRYASRAKNRESYLQKRREYRLSRLETQRKVDRACDEKNKDSNRARARQWKKDNHAIVIEYANRRKRVIKAQRDNLNSEQIGKIREIYKQCRLMNIAYGASFYCVDHIVPLNPQNESVCGLHIAANLKVITKTENSRKKDKFDGTYENESWRLNYEE